jgi:sugar/nucleoside kinase (ribokinase family)
MDVICLGILVADIFAEPIPAIPAPGQLADGSTLLGAGGCASNTAARLSRLGRKVKVFKVGTDLFGGFVLDDLRRLRIVRVSRSANPSNLRHSDRERPAKTVIHCVGANADFSFADINCSVLMGRVLMVGGYMVMPKFGPEDCSNCFALPKSAR